MVEMRSILVVTQYTTSPPVSAPHIGSRGAMRALPKSPGTGSSLSRLGNTILTIELANLRVISHEGIYMRV